jgi:hypothetical protein
MHHEQLDLRGLEMKDVCPDFQGLLMRNVDVSESNFEGCSLDYSTWVSCRMERCSFYGVGGGYSMLAHCLVKESRFGGYHPVWAYSVWRGVTARGTVFRDFSFDGMVVIQSDFTEADLRDADFWDVDTITRCTMPKTDRLVFFPHVGHRGKWVHLQQDRTSVGCTTCSNEVWVEMDESQFKEITRDKVAFQVWKTSRHRLAEMASRLTPYPDVVSPELQAKVESALNKGADSPQ